MLVSINWLRDFVDLPPDLDPHELAERFTRTTAEVDGVRRIEVAAQGLVAARLVDVADLPETRNLRVATLEAGRGRKIETVTAAVVLPRGAMVVYAPPRSHVAAFGTIRSTTVAGRQSEGMILPGEALGIPTAVQEAIFLDERVRAGARLAREPFDDFVLEIDNKSITNRPDLWGHYGVAREVAAIYRCALKPYPVAPLAELNSGERPQIEIDIADPEACPRYSALAVGGVDARPAPLWMQLRLGHVGMRPISGLVDLTNYIMAELGQPMHAFDAAKVDRIEVDRARHGEPFRTLDGVERRLTRDDLMIKCHGDSIALAGVMGGLETEVSEATQTLLLESANFNPATIRRTAARLGLRTEASARFEKSLDPANTVWGIQRFVELAGSMYPDMRLAGVLSDAYPRGRPPLRIALRLHHVARTIGRNVLTDEITSILEPLGFRVHEAGSVMDVEVPTFRATGDVSIEVDVIEEIARFVGYNTIEPAMPVVEVRRFAIHALHELEQQTIRFFTGAQGFHEVHGYLWYDSLWLERLGVDPGECVELSNPAAEGLHRLRRSLIPGLLAVVERNRFHFPAFSILETGSVFHCGQPQDLERRHAGLIVARRGRNLDDELYGQLKGAIETWAWERFCRVVRFRPVAAAPDRPWEHAFRTAEVWIEDRRVGRVSIVDAGLRHRMDEHLGAWGIAWAELTLSGLEELELRPEPLDAVPAFPLVDLDFSVLVPRRVRFEEVTGRVAAFSHPLLKRIRFLGSYEGQAIGPELRSLTFRTVIGDDTRTLVDEDVNAFRSAFETYVRSCGFTLRK